MNWPRASEPPPMGAQATVSNTDLEVMRRQSIQVLSSVAAALEAAGHQKRALCAEIAELEARRDELTRVVDVLAGAQPSSDGPLDQPNGSVVIRAIAADLLKRAVAHPIHPGFGNVATALFLALLIAMALLLSPFSQVFWGVRLLAVTSGSMAPAIPTGSMVAVRTVPPSELKPGDVITFATLGSPDVLVTHRIVGLNVTNGQTVLSTKGDANDAVDALSAPANRAVSRVDFALPWLGDAMIWLGSALAKTLSVGLAIVALGLSAASVRRSVRHPLPAH